MAKHPKAHINQINEDQPQRAHIKSSKGKATNNTQGIPIRITADLSVETLQARREWQESDEREKPTTQITVPGKELIQI